MAGTAVNAAGGREPLLACAVCGAWSRGLKAAASPRLAEDCAGCATRAGADAPRRLERGLFPKGDARFRGWEVEGLAPA